MITALICVYILGTTLSALWWMTNLADQIITWHKVRARGTEYHRWIKEEAHGVVLAMAAILLVPIWPLALTGVTLVGLATFIKDLVHDLRR